ncbi:MAG: methyltransferase domain-containing protein [Caldimonas sp.]
MVDGQTPRASSTWQADYLKQHTAEKAKYLETVAATGPLQQVAARAMELLALSSGATVLELGCGNGVFLPRLAAAVGSSGKVVGVDHSAELIAQAVARMAEARLDGVVHFEVGDAYALPFEDGTFDAAHCERVLMHLEDPNAALSELARVVKPGGIIVCAEPDWAGVRIDHPDREVFDRVFALAITPRNTDMGLTLFRRMGEIGLVNRRHAASSSVIEDFGTWKMFGLDLGPPVDQVAREGVFSAERIARILPALDAANESGRFYSAVTVHVIAGVVPAAVPKL